MLTGLREERRRLTKGQKEMTDEEEESEVGDVDGHLSMAPLEWALSGDQVISLSLSYTHTYIHTHRERERDRCPFVLFEFNLSSK